MQFFRGSVLVLLGLVSAVSLGGLTPSFTIDYSATNGQFDSCVEGDAGGSSFDALSNSDPATYYAFSGAAFGANSTGANGGTWYGPGGFSVNSAYSFDGPGGGYSNYAARGGIIATEVVDFTVNYAGTPGNGVSKFFINGFEINNPEGQTYSGRLNTGDRLELFVTGNVTGPGTLAGSRVLYAEICPVPEPATLAVLGGGVALLARRRRQLNS